VYPVVAVHLEAALLIYGVDRDECEVLSVCIQSFSISSEFQPNWKACCLKVVSGYDPIAAKPLCFQVSRRVRHFKRCLELLVAACRLFSDELVIEVETNPFDARIDFDRHRLSILSRPGPIR
jgi:hypothetical protein